MKNRPLPDFMTGTVFFAGICDTNHVHVGMVFAGNFYNLRGHVRQKRCFILMPDIYSPKNLRSHSAQR